MNRRLRGLFYTIPGLVLGATGAFSCSQVAKAIPGVEALAQQCGLACPDPGKGVISGNASISGNANIDGFFASVVHFSAAANDVTAGIQGELDAIAASVGAKAGDTADLKAKLTAKLAVTGGLKVSYQPPACQVDAHATLTAQAKCDATVDPGSASVQCQGSCTAEAGAKVDCGANATLSCTGTAPNLSCSGTCKGECQLDATAKCDGTCNGTCTGTCSVKDASGNCAGSCSGTCKGSCKLDAAASCSGTCKGECTYTPPSGQCDASASAHCDAKANAQVDCKGSCTGNVTPPSASAECQASAKADASVSATCTPPSLNVSFQFTGTAATDATAQADFQAWLEGFKGHVSAILAYKAKLDGLGVVAADLGANGQASLSAGFQTTLGSDVSVKGVIGLGCAVAELPDAIKMVTDAGASLTASGKAAVDVLGTVGVS
jgi:modification target Cys-rich repeat protein